MSPHEEKKSVMASELKVYAKPVPCTTLATAKQSPAIQDVN